MKHFFKVFAITTIILVAIIGISSYAYIQFQDRNSRQIGLEDEKKEEFGEVIKSKADRERVSVLFLGVDGARADTIIFGTYNLETNKVDLISIPRDTYCQNEYEDAAMKKINAVYPREGLRGMVESVEEILGIEDEINYFVEIDYDGVKSIVDSVGGVEVDVPFDMIYRDPYSDPPLDINIKKGTQVLKGQKAVDFLRYRTNNDYTQGYSEGDIGRIKAQQEFISSFMGKALGIRLPSVIKTSIEEVNTNIKLKDAISYGKHVAGLNGEDIDIMTLPGEARYKEVNGQNLSYFFVDDSEVKSIISGIFESSDKSETEVKKER